MAFGIDIKALIGFGDNERKIDSEQKSLTIGGDGYYQWSTTVKTSVDKIVKPNDGGKGNDKYIPGLKQKIP